MADLKRPKEYDYVLIFKSLLSDVERLTGLDMSRDWIEIESRGKHEGLSFLTKTLPAFYKHVLGCVEQRHFSPIVGFKTGRKGPLPLFLSGLVCGLFADDGTLRSVRESWYLGLIGQVCTFLYKCEFPYTSLQESQRLKKFLEVEDELPETLGRLTDKAETILRNAMELGLLIFRDFSITELPKNGPGATAAMEKAEEKYNFHFSERIEEYFPYDEWFSTRITESITPFICGESGIQVNRTSGGLLHVLSHAADLGWDTCPSRGIFVNKDSRGPRYISAEPKEHMWLQQALGRSLMRHCEANPYTAGHINFTDQQVNGQLALNSSSSGEFATVDLEDASDRVSLAVVRLLFPSNVVRLLEACRSNSAVLPDGTRVDLKKFAPMGSACCFPTESIVFYLLSVACLSYLRGWDFLKASEHVYVYGDDIIIPTWACTTLYEVFPEFCLRINENKSYSKGPFRESCGVDAIDGVVISSVKLRRPVPNSKEDTTTLISWMDTSNQLFYAGFWVTADKMVRDLRKFTSVPYVPYQSGIFGKTGYQSALQTSGSKIKWDKKYQRPSVKMRRVDSLTLDWSFSEAPRSATLHSTVVDGFPNTWDINGRSEVSTLVSSGETSKRLTLKHQKVLL